MKSSDLDEAFDAGLDVREVFDWAQARRPNLETGTLSVEVPSWILASIDREAEARGLSRQALIEGWLADRLIGAQKAADRA